MGNRQKLKACLSIHMKTPPICNPPSFYGALSKKRVKVRFLHQASIEEHLVKKALDPYKQSISFVGLDRRVYHIQTIWGTLPISECGTLSKVTQPIVLPCFTRQALLSIFSLVRVAWFDHT